MPPTLKFVCKFFHYEHCTGKSCFHQLFKFCLRIRRRGSNRLDICQKKIRFLSFWGKKITPKNALFAAFVNSQQKCVNIWNFINLHNISRCFLKNYAARKKIGDCRSRGCRQRSIIRWYFCVQMLFEEGWDWKAK